MVEKGAARTKVCPFLQNPLSDAKCYLTQSILLDTQKQKSVGDAVNGLEALGLVDRINGNFRVNEMGAQMARIDYNSKEWLIRMRQCAISYGLFLGFLYNAYRLSAEGIVERREIKPSLAFPETGDTVPDLLGNRIRVYTGCEMDTMTRTTSLLIKWGITLGFVSPPEENKPSDLSHVETLEAIKEENMLQKLRIHYSMEDLENVTVHRPISYSFLTPDAAARRDLPPDERRMSMQMSPRVINRRFALIYSLGFAGERKIELNFTRFKQELNKSSEFVVDSTNMDNAMNLELQTAIIAGMLWEKGRQPETVKPLVTMDLHCLSEGAPRSTLNRVNEIAAAVCK